MHRLLVLLDDGSSLLDSVLVMLVISEMPVRVICNIPGSEVRILRSGRISSSSVLGFLKSRLPTCDLPEHPAGFCQRLQHDPQDLLGCSLVDWYYQLRGYL